MYSSFMLTPNGKTFLTVGIPDLIFSTAILDGTVDPEVLFHRYGYGCGYRYSIEVQLQGAGCSIELHDRRHREPKFSPCAPPNQTKRDMTLLPPLTRSKLQMGLEARTAFRK